MFTCIISIHHLFIIIQPIEHFCKKLVIIKLLYCKINPYTYLLERRLKTVRNSTAKNSVIVTTLLSALFFCFILVLGSLSPLADSGPNVNTFGSTGLWLSLGMVLFLYLLPLAFYMLGMHFLKFVMAAFCSIGLLIAASTLLLMPALFLFGLEDFSGNLASIIGVMISCLGLLITNIVWFVAAFKRPSATVQESV